MIEFYGTVPAQTWTLNSAISSLDISTYFSATEGPLTYAVQSGALPTGVTLNTSTGVISGTPTVDNGTSPLVIRATDQAVQTADTNSFHVYLVGSEISLPTGERIFLVASEDRVFGVLGNDYGN